MVEVEVRHRSPLSASACFDRVADHVAFFAAGGLRCDLLQPGLTAMGGTGALREVHSGPLRLQEDITFFDAPIAMEYRIRSLHALWWRVPFTHELGRIECHANGAGCEVVWRTRFECTIPWLGGFLTREFARKIERSFRHLLKRNLGTA